MCLAVYWGWSKINNPWVMGGGHIFFSTFYCLPEGFVFCIIGYSWGTVIYMIGECSGV